MILPFLCVNLDHENSMNCWKWINHLFTSVVVSTEINFAVSKATSLPTCLHMTWNLAQTPVHWQCVFQAALYSVIFLSVHTLLSFALLNNQLLWEHTVVQSALGVDFYHYWTFVRIIFWFQELWSQHHGAALTVQWIQGMGSEGTSKCIFSIVK